MKEISLWIFVWSNTIFLKPRMVCVKWFFCHWMYLISHTWERFVPAKLLILAQWFWRFWMSSMFFFNNSLLSPLGKGFAFLFEKKLNPPHSMIFFVNQGWNWRMHSVSGEEDKYQTDSQTSRRTDKQAHEKHFLAINILQQSYRYNAGW